MDQLNEFFNKLEDKLGIGYSFIRIFLGIILFVRGWLIFSDPATIVELAGAEKSFLLYSYIAIAHMLGGFFLAVGYFTRFAALIQIPVLFSAAFLIHGNNGLMMGSQSFELAVLVFFLLLIYFVFGAGPVSGYHYFSKKNKAVN